MKIAAGAVVVILLLLILAVLIAVPAYVSSESGEADIVEGERRDGRGAGLCEIVDELV